MPSVATLQQRLQKIVGSLEKTEMDAILLNRVSNIAYLTGVVNSCSWVFITRKRDHLALVLESDVAMYRENSILNDIRTFRIHDPFHLFKTILEELGLTKSKIGIELSRPGLPQHTLDMLRYAFPPTVKFVNGEPILEEIRAIKSKEEVQAIEDAVKISELGMDVAIKNVKPGVRESDVVLEAEYAMRKAGGRITTLNYVGSGKRSCIAHHTPTQKVIEQGDVVTIDIHAGYGGYCADLARTVVCGKIDKEVEEAYRFLVQAEEETFRVCRSRATMVEAKKTFYRKLAEAKDFQFLLGPVLHGVGIMNYEMPYFTFPYQDKGRPEILESGMVVSVSNIGLFSERGWGVRIEDMALITEDEPIYLTHFPKELIRV